ncbi:Abi-like protein [Lachnoanaerobaculum saburreum F0468]|uniref:Abi-like protein n=1 Tax=Lachnoanaerobaculum saburreum F0468 TaxID=1095750 RepID=I0R6W8_9FIRM|nr:Abi family protein [Lachnoanaerobaculum saburreum]EIC95426.1 Abi-like protein [Lachnoanaerobaculum saburreum F0468]
MLSIYQLMKYLRNVHHINVKSNQTQALRNIGYYHGFKGYRFIREDTSRVKFTSLDEVIALNKYDMQLKAMLYPKVMFIENALKNYVIEALLADSKSENFDIIYNKSLTAYRTHQQGSDTYKKEFTKRMNLKGKINSALVRDYKNRSVVSHFFNNDMSIPVWAIFETLTLGEFGTLYDCASKNVKKFVSKIMKLPTNLDSDGMNTQFFIFTIKDLRNAIAHNNVIFDTRFKTGKIDKRLINLLESEVGISNIDFKYMDAYIIAIIYFLIKMRETKTVCKQFLTSYQQQTEYLRNELPINIYSQVVGTQHRNNMSALKRFISKS